jgi:hypothetical protein
LRLLAQLARFRERERTRGIALRESDGVRTDRGLAGTAEGSFVVWLLSRRITDKLGQYWAAVRLNGLVSSVVRQAVRWRTGMSN